MGKIFDDDVLATAIFDLLLHHSRTFNIEGDCTAWWKEE